MKPALIKLAKKIHIDPNTENEGLLKIRKHIFDIVVAEMENRNAANMTFISDSVSFTKAMKEELKHQSSFIIGTLNHRFPDELNTTEQKFEIGQVDITVSKIDKKSINTFEFDLYLTTKPLALIDVRGERLLIADTSKPEEALVKQEHDTFLLKLTDDYNISYYKE